MTRDDLWATFAVLDRVAPVAHEADIERGVVVVSMRDPKGGNVVVRTLTSVPSDDEARTLVAEMKAEIEGRAKGAASRRRAARNSYES